MYPYLTLLDPKYAHEICSCDSWVFSEDGLWLQKAFAGTGEWEETMDGWGSKVFEACTTVAEMLAIGKRLLELPHDPSSSLRHHVSLYSWV
jgi:hypothetical protein